MTVTTSTLHIALEESVLRRNNDIKQFNSENVVGHPRKLPEYCYLAVYSLAALDGLKGISDVLDGDWLALASADLVCLDHLAE